MLFNREGRNERDDIKHITIKKNSQFKSERAIIEMLLKKLTKTYIKLRSSINWSESQT